MSVAHKRNHETNGVTVSCSLQVTDTISADWIRTMLHSGVVYSGSMWGLERGTLLCLLSQGAQQHVSQCAAVVPVVVRNWWWCTGMGPWPRSHFHPNPLGTGPSVNLTPRSTETAVTEPHFLPSISFNTALWSRWPIFFASLISVSKPIKSKTAASLFVRKTKNKTQIRILKSKNQKLLKLFIPSQEENLSFCVTLAREIPFPPSNKARKLINLDCCFKSLSTQQASLEASQSLFGDSIQH